MPCFELPSGILHVINHEPKGILLPNLAKGHAQCHHIQCGMAGTAWAAQGLAFGQLVGLHSESSRLA